MRLEQVNNTKAHWEFIRNLRNDERVEHGFISNHKITEKEQEDYMTIHGHNYFIIFEDDMAVGFIGDVEDDLRICIAPEFQNKGLGTNAIIEFHKLYPSSLAKVKIDNIQSIRAFEKAGFEIKYVLMSKK